MTNETTASSGRLLGISHKPSRSGAVFTKSKVENKSTFIGYLPYGFSNPGVSLDTLRTMVEHGVDAVGIDLPYSDLVTDSLVIQAAASIAPNNGETIKRVSETAEAVANAGGVSLIMSYWNLVYHYGVECFVCDFEDVDDAGLITPDPIPDEAGEWVGASDRHGLDRIFLVSPDSSAERLEIVACSVRGFACAVARMGVTGECAAIDTSPELLAERTRQAGAENVCVGTGVSTVEQGAKVGSHADDVIVGPALVRALLADDDKTACGPKESLKLLAARSEELAEGIHSARQTPGVPYVGYAVTRQGSHRVLGATRAWTHTMSVGKQRRDESGLCSLADLLQIRDRSVHYPRVHSLHPGRHLHGRMDPHHTSEAAR